LEKNIPILVISFFKKSVSAPRDILFTDMHSHLLAGLDDGVKSHEEAIEIIKIFHELGYRKLITTPHIMSDYYRNNPAIIKQALDDLNTIISRIGIDINVQAAAEYYLDEDFIKKITNDEPLLTMGDKYLLFETNFFTEPYQLNELIFTAITKGYKPILAHPERYQYMTLEKAEELRNRGVYLQINIPSLLGVYGKPSMKLAMKLIELGWIDFIGSDCHNQNHIHTLEEAYKNNYFVKALELPLLNNSL
jgi:protein-tyrosine phosphatase